MSGTLHAFEYLDAAAASTCPSVCVLFGDEAFLKRLVKQHLRTSVFGNDADVPFATFNGKEVEWCDVADEIATVSLFGGSKRLAVVEEADPFVSSFRGKLEDYVEKPNRQGILVLDVETWASNTRLYKAIDKQYLQIDCRLPQRAVGKRTETDEPRLINWLVKWTMTQYSVVLHPAAAKLLLDLVGPQLGMLDQDLSKLSLFIRPKETITAKMVQDIVGGWKAKTIWEVVDAAADGNAAEAIRQLDMALQSGEHPQALFGQIAWSLRRFGVATRIFAAAERRGQRIALRDALQQAGFRPWPQNALADAERQIIQLGRDRAGKMLQWLLEADLAMKGSHSTPDRARFVLEQLFFRMARRTQPATARR